jgi:predicted dehydrogenase
MTRRAGNGQGQALRAAAVGLGWVCSNRHLPIMDRSAAYDVIGVIDRHPGRAREVARCRGYANFAETDRLADAEWLDDVDVVVVGAAPMAHYDLIGQALALGKHVLTEKPFAMAVGEGEALADTARQHGLGLGIVHNFQFARSTQRLLRDIADGAIGDLQSVEGVQLGNPRRRLPSWYEQLPLGLFYDESPHLLYLLHKVVGDDLTLLRADCFADRNGQATPALIDILYRAQSHDIPVTVRCNFNSPVSEWYLLVHGDRALGIVDLFRDIYVRLPNDEAHTAATILRTSVNATVQHWSQHVPSGIGLMRGNLFYGTDEVFARFADGICGASDRLAPIGDAAALSVLRHQHEIIAHSKTYEVGNGSA